ncbi:hypothetical protein NR798_28170 [Archangium gephyra]|uniref:hypothetical protein n=1 Tax=Archangium gephyra TaxID=48 RepID=UPI0035D4CF85
MKSARYMLIAAALVLVLAAAVAFRSGTKPEEAQSSAPVATRPAPEAGARPTARAEEKPAVLVEQAVAAATEEAEEHGEFTSSLDLLKRKILKKDPQLAQFAYFREHVLMDSANRRDYQKLLSDKAMYERTRDALLHPEGSKDSMESNIKRLVQIDYLREALNYKDNPERAQLLSTLGDIIFQDTFGADMAPEVKRSLAATKMELFEILSEQEPERVKALVESARGTRLEGMLAYFADHNQRRQAKERELSLQAQIQAKQP